MEAPPCKSGIVGLEQDSNVITIIPYRPYYLAGDQLKFCLAKCVVQTVPVPDSNHIGPCPISGKVLNHIGAHGIVQDKYVTIKGSRKLGSGVKLQAGLSYSA